jgi:predicted unusual protein kinase regulating ubiquinone biosynthesis (AarF/ABC1/UbiB family)
MTMINLALMTAEGLGKRLAPELNIAHEALPYLKEALGLQFQTPPVGAGSGRPAAQA